MEKIVPKCKITGLERLNEQKTDALFYNVNFEGDELIFRFCKNCYDKPEIAHNKNIILSLFLNNKVHKVGNEILHWDDNNDDDSRINLKNLVQTAVYPRTPKEKLENLFKELFKLQKYDGEIVETSSNFFTTKKALSLYFKNKDELKYYVKALASQKDIHIVYNPESNIISRFNFTYQGLNNYIQLFETGYNSRDCFIAMSFDKDEHTANIRKNIKDAINDTGYNPILVDEGHINSDKTIIDEMIHKLRNSKFCIADFTGQKGGVYFESGFAVGQGKPVIYTCHADDFQNVHFDIKQLQHIIYNTPEELKAALKHKIKAWII